MQAKGGFYFVRASKGALLLCRARGRLKEKGSELLVGDIVEVKETSTGEGVIENVLPRRNRMRRPPAANIDQAVAVISVKDPPVDLHLLDRILLAAEEAGLEILICFSKADLLQSGETESLSHLKAVYQSCGYGILFISAATGCGFNDLEGALESKVSVLTGPSGAGKTTLINTLKPGLGLLSSPVSEKNKRGRQTTRSAKLINLQGDAYIVDTPGFQRLDIKGFTSDNLAWFFPEMRALQGLCRFAGCSHVAEPDCAVKEALEEKKIAEWRYEHYLAFLKEIKEAEKFFGKKND